MLLFYVAFHMSTRVFQRKPEICVSLPSRTMYFLFPTEPWTISVFPGRSGRELAENENRSEECPIELWHRSDLEIRDCLNVVRIVLDASFWKR